MLVNEGVWGSDDLPSDGIVLCEDRSAALRAMHRANERMLEQLDSDPARRTLDGLPVAGESGEIYAPRLLERGVFTGVLDREILADEAVIYTSIVDEELVAECVQSARLVPGDKWDWFEHMFDAFVPRADALDLDEPFDLDRFVVGVSRLLSQRTTLRLRDFRVRTAAYAEIAANHSVESDWTAKNPVRGQRLELQLNDSARDALAAAVSTSEKPFMLCAAFLLDGRTIVATSDRGLGGVRLWRGLPDDVVADIRAVASSAPTRFPLLIRGKN